MNLIMNKQATIDRGNYFLFVPMYMKSDYAAFEVRGQRDLGAEPAL